MFLSPLWCRNKISDVVTDHFEDLNMKEFLWHCWWCDNNFKLKTTIDYRFLPRCKTFSSLSLSELCHSQIINLSRPRQLPLACRSLYLLHLCSPDIKFDKHKRPLSMWKQYANEWRQSYLCQAASGTINQALRLNILEFVLNSYFMLQKSYSCSKIYTCTILILIKEIYSQ